MKTIKKPLLMLLCVIGMGASMPGFASSTTQDQTTFQVAARYWWWDSNYQDRRDRERYNEWCRNHPRKCQEQRDRHRVWCDRYPRKCVAQRGW